MTTPTINTDGVVGTVGTGNTLTISGTNMHNESTANYLGTGTWATDEMGFEGASDLADNWQNSGLTYATDVKIIGDQSAYWVGSGNTGEIETSSGGIHYRIDLTNTPQAHWWRWYFRADENGGDGSWCDGYHKYMGIYDADVSPGNQLNINARTNSANGYTGVLFIINQGDGGEFYCLWGNDSKYQGQSTQEAGQWYCIEVYVPADGSPVRCFLNGEEVSNVGATAPYSGWSTNPSLSPYDMQFPWNMSNGGENSSSSYNQKHYYDSMAVSSTRVYPACKVEIGNSSDYATATKKYQWPHTISDTSVVVEADLTGLGDGPYWLWVTNGQNERSSAFSLSEGGGGSSAGSATFSYFR